MVAHGSMMTSPARVCQPPRVHHGAPAGIAPATVEVRQGVLQVSGEVRHMPLPCDFALLAFGGIRARPLLVLAKC